MRILAKQATEARRVARAKKSGKDDVKYEYDSDEDTEGGTWEHKRRKTEMEKTEGTFTCRCKLSFSSSFIFVANVQFLGAPPKFKSDYLNCKEVFQRPL